MHVTGMSIGGIPPFTEQIDFELDGRVNLFIGPNATGKSTILRQLASKTPEDDKFSFTLSEDWLEARQGGPFRRSSLRRRNAGPRRSDASTGSEIDLTQAAQRLPWIYVPSTRHTLPLSDDRESMQNLQASSWDIDANRERAITSLDVSRILNDSRYLFDGNSVRQACKAITDLFRMKRIPEHEFLNMQSVKSVAHQCAQSICSDVLLEDREPQDYIHAQRLEGATLSVTNVYDDMGVATFDSGNKKLFVGDLSSGTQGTLLWIWHLSLRIATFYNFERGWHNLPAVLLIDEIENNLHPTWQRRVIPALIAAFDGLQIFASTHSPFVVAGREGGQVHRLYRDDNQVLSAELPNNEKIVGWTADEILRTMMGVEYPTDKETSEAATELRRLLNKGTENKAEDEEERQAKIQRLRRLVNRDMLAGGPAAAQRELFEQQFSEALEKYRQSRDLGQESG